MKKFSFLISISLGLLLFLGSMPSLFAQANMAISNADDPNGGWFVYELNPGDSVEGTFKISNYNETEQAVRIDAADARNSGAFQLKYPDEVQETIGAWTTVHDPLLVLDPMNGIFPAEETGTFTLTIPENAPPGDYAGAIVMSPTSYESAVNELTNGAESSSSGMTTVIRIGNRVYVSVLGDTFLEFAWDKFDHSILDGLHRLDFEFNNTGTVVVDPTVSVSFNNLFGKDQVIEKEMSPIMPRTVSPFAITWETPPKFGFITAKATINYSEGSLLDTGEEEDNPAEVFTLEKSVSFLIIPVLETIISLVVFLILFVLLYMRHRKFKKAINSYVSYTVSKDGMLPMLAQKYNVNWKFLAQVNKIKAPYMIAKGQKILVPPTNKKK